MHNYLSDCCNALPDGEIDEYYYSSPYDERGVYNPTVSPWGRCSKCKEMTIFWSESDQALEEVDW